MIPTKKDQEILAKWSETEDKSLYELIEAARNDGHAYLTDITHRSYEATKRRGLIDGRTDEFHFVRKLEEEVDELHKSCNEIRIDRCFDPSELADVALVCFAMAEHYGIDLIEEMRKKTEFNEKRT